MKLARGGRRSLVVPKRLPFSYKGRRRWTVVDARAVLEALSRSGMSMSVFAQREGLDVQRLRRWARRLELAPAPRPAPARGEGTGTSAPPRFLEVPRLASPELVEVVLRSGLVVRASASIEPDVLRHLVDALDEERQSC